VQLLRRLSNAEMD
jgi:hypothetical protein